MLSFVLDNKEELLYIRVKKNKVIHDVVPADTASATSDVTDDPPPSDTGVSEQKSGQSSPPISAPIVSAIGVGADEADVPPHPPAPLPFVPFIHLDLDGFGGGDDVPVPPTSLDVGTQFPSQPPSQPSSQGHTTGIDPTILQLFADLNADMDANILRAEMDANIRNALAYATPSQPSSLQSSQGSFHTGYTTPSDGLQSQSQSHTQ